MERYGASVFTPPSDAPGSTAISSQAFAQVFGAGDRLRCGVEAFPGMEPNDLVLWIERRQALVAGDTLIDRGEGFECPVDWANKGVPAEQIRDTLLQLLDLHVAPVLPTHGVPTDRAALARALS